MRSAESQTTVRSIIHSTVSLNNAYSFTVKHTSRYPTLAQYNRVINRWAKLGFYAQTISYELDSIGKLHIHGIAMARGNYLLNKLNIKSYSIKVDPMLSEQEFKGWYNYITKEYQNLNNYEKDLFLSEYEIRSSESPFLNKIRP